VLLNLEFLARELKEGLALPLDAARVEALQRRVDDTRHGAERVRATVRDLQALTRKDENIRGPVELEQVLEQAISLAQSELEGRARVETRFETVPCMFGNVTRLEQLFLHLLVNAAHACDKGPVATGVIRITLAPMDPANILVEVTDDGCGMDADVLSRAFEPFFTTKALGVGAGLGLPIAKRIVEDLLGRITVTSHQGQGTTVRITFPVHGVTSQPSALTGAIASKRGRVLIVDDERAVADSLRFALKDVHDIDTASSGKEARSALATGTDYDVVLCDLAMPVESGMDLFAYASEHYPATAQRFVFMTGGAFTARAERFLRDTPNLQIEKPFELEALRALIDGMVTRRERQGP
jgi:CheY-like chemotaxis protein/two-component sensor histidine kinase